MTSYLKQFVNQFFLIAFSLSKINIIKIFYKQNKKSNNIIWIFPIFPKGIIQYFATAAVIQDLSLLYSIRDLKDYRIFIGPKIGKIRNKKVFYNFTDRFNPLSIESNSRFLQSIISMLVDQGCKTYPSLDELRYWEDKEYMYQKFKEKNIPHPNTHIVKIKDDNLEILKSTRETFSYPILLKEHFGNQSKGLHFIQNENILKTKLDALYQRSVTSASIQQLLNSDSDHRVIVIHNKVEQNYERVRNNAKKEWQTTSTKFGTILDFKKLEPSLILKFENLTKELGLSNAAFDAIIDKDNNINILEVSSSYYTNPKPLINNNEPYLNFKKKIIPHSKEKINVVFRLKKLWLKKYIGELKE